MILRGHDGKDSGVTQAEIDGSKIPFPGQVCAIIPATRMNLKEISFLADSETNSHTLLLLPEDRQHHPRMRSS